MVGVLCSRKLGSDPPVGALEWKMVGGLYSRRLEIDALGGALESKILGDCLLWRLGKAEPNDENCDWWTVVDCYAQGSEGGALAVGALEWMMMGVCCLRRLARYLLKAFGGGQVVLFQQ